MKWVNKKSSSVQIHSNKASKFHLHPVWTQSVHFSVTAVAALMCVVHTGSVPAAVLLLPALSFWVEFSFIILISDKNVSCHSIRNLIHIEFNRKVCVLNCIDILKGISSELSPLGLVYFRKHLQVKSAFKVKWMLLVWCQYDCPQIISLSRLLSSSVVLQQCLYDLIWTDFALFRRYDPLDSCKAVCCWNVAYLVCTLFIEQQQYNTIKPECTSG